MRAAIVSILACALALAASPARAEVTFFGDARAVPRSRSASRDAPAFNLTVLPRQARTAAGEFAIVTVPTESFSVRTGFYGSLDLESNSEPDDSFNLMGSGDVTFWRGAYGYYVAASLDALGRRMCAKCALEGALLFRHESEHYTGSNDGGEGTDYSDRPLFGDAFVLDAAAAWGAGDVRLLARVQNDFFVPDRSGYTVGPGIDLHARYQAWEKLHFFLSGFAEYLFGAQVGAYRYPDAYLVRGLAGIAVPSSLGDMLVYLSADVGHRKGLAVYTEEATLGFGFRFAFGQMPAP